MIDLQGIEPDSAAQLRQAFDHKKLAHSYLFVDPTAERAKTAAYWLACLFNCTGKNRPDGTCRNCQQILSGNHPDVLLIGPEGRETLGIDQVRPLKAELAKSPAESTCRFFFIESAEKLTAPAANALLNLLEEPIAPVVTILLTTNSNQILPTVRSRTQLLKFGEPSIDSKTSQLLASGLTRAELAEVGETTDLDQQIKYYYEECLADDLKSVVTAYQLAALAPNHVIQKYVLIQLKLKAQAGLQKPEVQMANMKFLAGLVEVDKLRFSHVNFKQALEYLALQGTR